ncbi:glycosyltransferase [Desulfosoma sp.]
MFHIPRERIRFFPLAPPRLWLKLPPFPVQDYILAYGNSDRDYDTLLEASRKLSQPLIILSQNYTPRRSYENVTFVKRLVNGLNLAKLVGSARFVVIPLKSAQVSAGQTAMLETMAVGRPVIVTENPATIEYGKHGESAFFYQAGHVAELRDLLERLWKDRNYAESVGQRARVVHTNLPEIRESLLLETVRGLCHQKN